MLICPNCRSENDDDSGTCFTCGSSLGSTAAIRRGSVIANRYEIQEPLGKGGMGMVYKAHDRDLDETVALKLLRADIAADPEMQKRFRSEIKLARKVRHRNVCGIHEFGQDGNLRFIAMEYLEGVDLRHVLQRKGAPLPEEAFEISIQVGQGLQAIHDAGIVHRDLKTPNIMRDSRGHVRLMDFGIAKQIGAEATMGATQMGMIVGTPEYMSPEQARGEKIDFRSDIYAWGIVTFEIFTGAVPFKGDTPIATIFKHLQDPPPLQTPGLPESLLPVLAKSLAKNPSDRYNTCTEMVDALQEARASAFPNWRPSPSGSLRAPTGPSFTPLPGTSVLPTPSPTRIPNQPPTLVKDGGGTPRPQATLISPTPPAAPTVKTPAPSAEAAHRQAAVRDLLARAEGLASTQRLEEAHGVLKQAADLEPGSTLVNRLLAQTAADLKRLQDAQAEEGRRREAEERQEAERARREEAEKERALAESAEKERTAAERAAAEKAAAERAAGERAAAERALADQAARERAERERRAEEERRAAADAARMAEDVHRQQEQKRQQEEARAREKQQRAEAERKKREAAEQQAAERAESERQARLRAEADRAAEKARADRAAADEERRKREARELRRQQEAEKQERARQQSAGTEVHSGTALPAPASPAGKSWVIPAVAAAVLAVLVAGGIAISRRGTTDVETPGPAASASAPLPPEPVPPTVPGMGVLIVNALPWAEVVEIVDAKGKRHALGGSPYTPLTLSLPPGEYTVSLKSPGASRPQSRSAKVDASGQPARVSAEFGKVDAIDYFKKTGW